MKKLCTINAIFLCLIFFTLSSFTINKPSPSVNIEKITPKNFTIADIISSFKKEKSNNLTKKEQRIIRKETRKKLILYTKQRLQTKPKKTARWKRVLTILGVIIAIGLFGALGFVVAYGGAASWIGWTIFIVGAAASIWGGHLLSKKIKENEK